MKRKMFTFAAGLSAVLLVAAGVLWVLSHTRGAGYPHLQLPWDGRRWELYAIRGWVGIWNKPEDDAVLDYDGALRDALSTTFRRILRTNDALNTPGATAAERDALMDQLHQDTVEADAVAKTLRPDVRLISHRIVHLAAPVAVLPVIPTLWVVSRLRTRRWLRRGFCRACGYDLTANESGRCPECGAVAEGAA